MTDQTEAKFRPIRLSEPTHLGAALREIRTEQGLTRSELARRVAERAGIPFETAASQLQRYEKGWKTANLAVIGPVLQELGASLAVIPRSPK